MDLKGYILWIAVSEAVGGLSAWLTREGMKIYNATAIKPPLSPPPIVFAIVWPILYLLMGIGMARAMKAPNSVERSRAKSLYFLQLAMNFCWSILFFNLRGYGFAFIWLVAMWIAIVLMAMSFYSLDKPAGLMQIPYILWVIFAGYLNFMTWQLN